MRTRSRIGQFIVMWGVCTSLCGAASPLYAQGAPAAQPAGGAQSPEKRAADLYKKGNELYDKSKFADAETMYRAAFELRQTFEIAGNLGDVELILNRPKDAAEHLAFALRNFPATGKPPQKEALQKRLKDATDQIGTAKISASVEGADIFLDGKALGKSPLGHEVYLDQGEHVFEAKMDTYEPAKESVKAEAGAIYEVKLVLKKKQAPKQAPKPEPEPVQEDDGFFGPKMNWIIVAGGGMISIAGFAAGIGLSIAAGDKTDEADALRAGLDARKAPLCNSSGLSGQDSGDCSSLKEALGDHDSYANWAVPAFVIGGLAAAGTAAYAFWPRKKANSKPTTGLIQPVPVLGPKEGGLWLRGQF